MSDVPTGPATGETQVLLNQAVLHLSPDLRVSQLSPERVALKHRPAAVSLVVAPAQWRLLQEFKGGRTVAAVLCQLISDQHDPSLRELYELVVKAARAGVLQCAEYPGPAPATPVRWPFRLGGTVIRWLTAVAAVAAVLGVVLHPLRWPEQPLWLVAGWLAVCAAASLGTLLAASVVRASKGEVYALRLEWKTLLPRLEAGLDDARLGGRAVEVNTALARLLPHLALLAATAWRFTELQPSLAIGVLVVLCPLWGSPLQSLLGALYRDPRLATTYDLVFARDRLFRLLSRTRQQLDDGKFLLACAGATVGWLALVFLLACVALQAGVTEVLTEMRVAGAAHRTALAGATLAGLAVLGVAGFVGWSAGRHLLARWRERQERQLRPAAVLVSPRTIGEWLGRTVLFRDLPPAELAAVAAAVKPEEHKRGSYVVREGEPGDRLYVVLSGRLEVRRDYAPGRSEPVAEMGEGDVFGEISLLQGGPRTRSIRSLERSVLLALNKADFERLVLSRISRQAVEDAVQKVGFLQHIRLTRNWSQATLAAFAGRAKLHEATEGSVILEEGKPNHWFFVLHRGEVAVRVKGREVRRLKPGDSFGELSLLGAGTATATVTVTSKLASLLTIAARDFLDFVSHDFAVGLSWEDTRKPRKEKKKS
ncbi:MAG: cyclic nucleotide-binding domain-containing protein [Verrucomicrobiota bacterium]